MTNLSMIVGRLEEEPEITETKGTVIVRVARSYKNENGEYDNDYIKCYLWRGIAQATKQYCHKGDLIGIKGRLQCSEKNGQMILVAEKITTLTSQKQKEEN